LKLAPLKLPQYGIPIWRLWPNIRFLPSTVTEKNAPKNILNGRKDRGTTVYPPSPFGERGYNNWLLITINTKSRPILGMMLLLFWS
jgi:hypothetical protein